MGTIAGNGQAKKVMVKNSTSNINVFMYVTVLRLTASSGSANISSLDKVGFLPCCFIFSGASSTNLL